MPRLKVASGRNAGKEYELEGEAILGRSDTADVPVADTKASREHCRVYESGGRWVVVDLNSRNGITVNGVKTTRKNLRNGDKIAIGQTVIVFTGEGVAAPAAKSGGAKPKPRSAQSKKEAAFAAARADSRSPGGSGGGGDGDGGLVVSDRVLQFNKVDASKANLFDIDLSQASTGMQLLIWVGGLGLVALAVWGIASLMGVSAG